MCFLISPILNNYYALSITFSIEYDFNNAPQTAVIPPFTGQMDTTIYVDIYDDDITEPEEVFVVVLDAIDTSDFETNMNVSVVRIQPDPNDG